MPLQDLTPELRTRLDRAERTVGWFVTLAAVILLAGFAYYLYTRAVLRGWFVVKINYATALNSAAGMSAGDPVTLMGFNVGKITDIVPNDPAKAHGVTIYFRINTPYWGYIWYDSKVRVNSDFLNHRSLEVMKGQNGQPSAFPGPDGRLMVMKSLAVHSAYTNLLDQLTNLPANRDQPMESVLIEATNQLMDLIKSNRNLYYTNAVRAGYTKAAITHDPPNYYYILPLEEPALADRLAVVATTIQTALPSILSLTNQLNAVLTNANHAVNELNMTLAQTHPTLSNLTVITGNLRDPNGSLGNWLLPTNLTAQLDQTLASARETLGAARGTLDTTDTNLTKVATDLDETLQHLSDLTSNLAWQVHANSNLVTEISTTILHTDDLVQGLKREWFLRGAFKKKHGAQPAASDSNGK